MLIVAPGKLSKYSILSHLSCWRSLCLTFDRYVDSFQSSRPKAKDIERPYRCTLCRRNYGTLSALSLHIRIKHETIVRLMMGLTANDEMLSIHGRSVGAYMNGWTQDNFIEPRYSLRAAMAIQRQEEAGSSQN